MSGVSEYCSENVFGDMGETGQSEGLILHEFLLVVISVPVPILAWTWLG